MMQALLVQHCCGWMWKPYKSHFSVRKVDIIMKKVNTVLGEVEVTQMENVLSHEHIVCCSHAMKLAFGDKWFNTEELISIASELLKKAKDECGINTIIDGTPVNLGRDIKLMQEISKRTGVNIIPSTGLYYTEDYFLTYKSAELLSSFFIDECLNGINGTNIKPGFLKCATNNAGVTPLNEKSLITMSIVQRETNLPLFSHNCHEKKTAYKQIDIFEKKMLILIRLL